WTAAVIKERSGGLSYALYATDGAAKPPAGYIRRSSDVEVAGPAALPLNTWTHLAVTYDAANLPLYVNGTLVAPKAQTGNTVTSTKPLRFGGDSVWGEYFKGFLDEVRVYNRALSAAEIQTDMNTPVGGGAGGLALDGAPGGEAGPLAADALAPIRAEAIAR